MSACDDGIQLNNNIWVTETLGSTIACILSARPHAAAIMEHFAE